jgi:hypothetical protein
MPRAYSAGRLRCFGAASGIVAASARCVPNVEVGFQENPTECWRRVTGFVSAMASTFRGTAALVRRGDGRLLHCVSVAKGRLPAARAPLPSGQRFWGFGIFGPFAGASDKSLLRAS